MNNQKSLFSGMFLPYEYCGKIIYLFQDDIDSGRNRIRISDENGTAIKGDAGLIGRMLMDGLK